MVDPNALGRPLGDPAFDPFWKAAADLEAPVVLHPFLLEAVERFRTPLPAQPGRLSLRDDAGRGQPHPGRNPRSVFRARRGARARRRLSSVPHRPLRPRAPDAARGARATARVCRAATSGASTTTRSCSGRTPSAISSGPSATIGSLLGSDHPFWMGDPEPLRVVRDAPGRRRGAPRSSAATRRGSSASRSDDRASDQAQGRLPAPDRAWQVRRRRPSAGPAARGGSQISASLTRGSRAIRAGARARSPASRS